MAMELKFFQQIATGKISDNARIFLNDEKTELKASYPLGQNKLVSWHQARSINPETKQNQNVEIRKEYATALKERYGVVIGEAAAERVLQGGDKRLTKREIKEILETTHKQFEGYKTSVQARRDHYVGKTEAGKQEFATIFNRMAEEKGLTFQNRQLTIDDFDHSTIQIMIGKTLGAINIGDKNIENIKDGQAIFNRAPQIRDQEISNFLDMKKDALAELDNNHGDMKAILSQMILEDATIGKHEVRLFNQAITTLSQGFDRVISSENGKAEGITFLMNIQKSIRNMIEEYKQNLPTGTMDKSRLNDESLILAALKVIVSTHPDREYIGQAISSLSKEADFASHFGARDIKELYIEGFKPQAEHPSFQQALDFCKMQKALDRMFSNGHVDMASGFRDGTGEDMFDIEKSPSFRAMDQNAVATVLQTLDASFLYDAPLLENSKLIKPQKQN